MNYRLLTTVIPFQVLRTLEHSGVIYLVILQIGLFVNVSDFDSRQGQMDVHSVPRVYVSVPGWPSTCLVCRGSLYATSKSHVRSVHW